jgi:hypothetical protein
MGVICRHEGPLGPEGGQYIEEDDERGTLWRAKECAQDQGEARAG